MAKYDVAVIGAGPGGYVAAIRAAQLDGKVAVIEKELLGGVCLNWGCIPTKTLLACADAFSQVKEAGRFGVKVEGEVSCDWEAMLERKRQTVEGLRNGIEALLKSNGVDVIRGTASFVDRKTLKVAGAEKSPRKIEAGAIIVATGGETVVPGFVPRHDNILTSKSALDNPELPESVIVLGGGIIGCEFACLYERLGVEVTVVEMLPQILPNQDKDVARTVATAMKKRGIKVMTNSRMTDIAAKGKGVSAKVGDAEIAARAMLVCVGRRPVTDGLNLAAAGLKTDEQGLLPVNEKCRTKAPSIYAIGDASGMLQLAHRASAMGVCAASNAMGQPDTYRDDLVPSCIFTAPEIGAVGRTEADLREAGVDVKVGKFPFAALGKAHAIQETGGFCKVVADAETDQVLGVQIVGPHATDLIAEAATAMHLETTAAELARAIHAHPTLAEAVMEAAHAVHDQCIHLPRPRRKR